METLQIEFYEKDFGAVQIERAPDSMQQEKDDQKLFTDTFLFGCYTLRQMRNLGNHPVTKSLATMLADWYPFSAYKMADGITKIEMPYLALYQHVILDAAIEMGMSWDMANEKYREPVLLTQYQGPGKKRFIGKLDGLKKKPIFTLDAKGFFLGKDINLYAPDSVFLFLSYLEVTYAENRKYLDGLKVVANNCAQALMKNEITMTNQEDLAFKIVTDQGIGNP